MLQTLASNNPVQQIEKFLDKRIVLGRISSVDEELGTIEVDYSSAEGYKSFNMPHPHFSADSWIRATPEVGSYVLIGYSMNNQYPEIIKVIDPSERVRLALNHILEIKENANYSNPKEMAPVDRIHRASAGRPDGRPFRKLRQGEIEIMGKGKSSLWISRRGHFLEKGNLVRRLIDSDRSTIQDWAVGHEKLGMDAYLKNCLWDSEYFGVVRRPPIPDIDLPLGNLLDIPAIANEIKGYISIQERVSGQVTELKGQMKGLLGQYTKQLDELKTKSVDWLKRLGATPKTTVASAKTSTAPGPTVASGGASPNPSATAPGADPQSTADPGGTDTSRESFARDVLKGLGAPVSDKNVAFLMAWMQWEGSKAAWNPMSSMWSMPGNTKFNKEGVRNYPTRDMGVQVTIKTLSNKNFPTICAAIRAGDPESSFTATAEWKRYTDNTDYTKGIKDTMNGYLANPERKAKAAKVWPWPGAKQVPPLVANPAATTTTAAPTTTVPQTTTPVPTTTAAPIQAGEAPGPVTVDSKEFPLVCQESVPYFGNIVTTLDKLTLVVGELRVLGTSVGYQNPDFDIAMASLETQRKILQTNGTALKDVTEPVLDELPREDIRTQYQTVISLQPITVPEYSPEAKIAESFSKYNQMAATVEGHISEAVNEAKIYVPADIHVTKKWVYTEPKLKKNEFCKEWRMTLAWKDYPRKIYEHIIGHVFDKEGIEEKAPITGKLNRSRHTWWCDPPNEVKTGAEWLDTDGNLIKFLAECATKGFVFVIPDGHHYVDVGRTAELRTGDDAIARIAGNVKIVVAKDIIVDAANITWKVRETFQVDATKIILNQETNSPNPVKRPIQKTEDTVYLDSPLITQITVTTAPVKISERVKRRIVEGNVLLTNRQNEIEDVYTNIGSKQSSINMISGNIIEWAQQNIIEESQMNITKTDSNIIETAGGSIMYTSSSGMIGNGRPVAGRLIW